MVMKKDGLVILGEANAKIKAIFFAGGIGVIPTDTLYGIVGSALIPEAVERIYKLRKRNKAKPMIVLIASLADLKLFDVKLSAKEAGFLKEYWPGKLSVIFKVSKKEFAYLHRGTQSIAFRLPKLAWLQKLLKETGPLVAPSANFEGEKPALTIKEAVKYFKNEIDFYLDDGKKNSAPSTLIKFERGKPVILRQGAVSIDS